MTILKYWLYFLCQNLFRKLKPDLYKLVSESTQTNTNKCTYACLCIHNTHKHTHLHINFHETALTLNPLDPELR